MSNTIAKEPSNYDMLNDASESTNPEQLALLSTSTLWTIRNAVAKNPSADEKTLFRLSQDKESWTIREEVAYNKNTPKWVLETMALYETNFSVIDVIVNREDATNTIYENILLNPNVDKFFYAKQFVSKQLDEYETIDFCKNRDFYETRIAYAKKKKARFLKPILSAMKLVEEYDSEMNNLIAQKNIIEDKYVSKGLDIRNRECQAEKRPIVVRIDKLREDRKKAVASVNGNKWNVWREDERLLHYEEEYDRFLGKPTIHEYEETSVGNAISTGFYAANTPEWHDLRAKGVGGSEIGIIMGVNPYKTADKLFLEKTGQEEQAFSKSSNIVRGNSYEPIIRRQFAMDNPHYKVWNTKSSWRNINDTTQLANLDGLYSTDGSDTPDAILEIKSISKASEWKQGIPEYYRLQLLWYMDTLGFTTGTIRAVVAEYGGMVHNVKHYYDYTITLDPAEMAHIRETVKAFQEKVEAYKNTLF